LTTTVLKEVSDTLTILHATVDAASKTTTPAIRACYRTDTSPVGAGCDETTALVSVLDSSTGVRPGYITLAGNVLTVAATANSQAATHVMQITHDTKFEDANIVFSTVTVVINVCVITNIDPPNNPGAQAYKVHALNPININMASPGFVQRPACGYTLTEVFAWSFNPNPAPPLQTTNGQPYKLTISSTTNSHAAVYQATLTNSVTYQSQSFLPTVAFQVTVTDPCLTTVIAPFTIGTVASGASHGVITQEAGQVIETTFTEPAHSEGTAVGSQSICGAISYTVTKRADGAAQTLVTISTVTPNTTHKLTSTTNLETDEGTHELKLTVSLSQTTYPTLTVNFDLVIQPATCNCKLLNWVMPTTQSMVTTVKKEVPDTITILHPTVDASSKTTTPMIRSCYRTTAPVGAGCNEATAITGFIEKGATLPSFITRATNVVTVNSQNNSEVKVYTMQVTVTT
jgi:GTP:adenosylcobinamide-phosphate guanylyltransferase